MPALSQEFRNVQNPALGAVLLWRFACGYINAHRTKEPLPLPLLFMALPMLLNKQIEEFLTSTRTSSGLRAFATKFGESRLSKQDVLLSIHDRVMQNRAFTMDSLGVAVGTRLLSLTPSGGVIALTTSEAKSGVPNEVRTLMANAQKLGSWCSNLTLHEVSTTLKLRF